jgi:hypothetical protein
MINPKQKKSVTKNKNMTQMEVIIKGVYCTYIELKKMCKQ